MVRVVMDIFINQNASKLFIDFLLCVLLKSGTRGFFVLARVCSYCAGVNIYLNIAGFVRALLVGGYSGGARRRYKH